MLRDAVQRERMKPLPSVSVSPLPGNFVARLDAVDGLREKMLARKGSQSQPIALTAVQGMGGIGKTVLIRCSVYRVQYVHRLFRYDSGSFNQLILALSGRICDKFFLNCFRHAEAHWCKRNVISNGR